MSDKNCGLLKWEYEETCSARVFGYVRVWYGAAGHPSQHVWAVAQHETGGFYVLRLDTTWVDKTHDVGPFPTLEAAAAVMRMLPTESEV